ncbi:hypothetical protein FS842_008645 [Serendipita sp. 407]|nr:hypothetical protein FS842_008645 [Serendipita sp. 407]
MTTHPEVLWAQRSSDSSPEKNIVYLTVNLPDVIESTLQYDLSATGLKFKAKAGNEGKGLQEKEYEFSIEFYDEVDPEQSSKRLSSRALDLILRKKTAKAEFWPKLYKGAKLQFVKTNFSKWVDEDEQDETQAAVEEDFDPMGGMGGMGGMDFESVKFKTALQPILTYIVQMLAQMKQNQGNAGDEGEDEDEDDDAPPPLEDAPAASK